MCVRIFALRKALLILAVVALSCIANAQTMNTIYTFSETTSFWPQGALLEDGSGNLYGTTRGGVSPPNPWKAATKSFRLFLPSVILRIVVSTSSQTSSPSS